MMKEDVINKEPSLYNSFKTIVGSYLKIEGKKYPMLFTFAQKVLVPTIKKESFEQLIVSIWREKNDICFQTSVDGPCYNLSQLPYDRCRQFEFHEDYHDQEDDFNCRSIADEKYSSFLQDLIKIIRNTGKTKIKILFEGNQYIPSLSLIPNNEFIVWGSISSEGICLDKKIKLVQSRESTVFFEPHRLPWNKVVSISEG